MATWNETTRQWTLSAAERAMRSGVEAPIAVHAELSARGRKLTVYMDDEVDLVFSADAVPPLATQPTAALKRIHVGPGGSAVEWPAIGVRLDVARLVAHGPAIAAEGPPAAARVAATRAATSKVAAPKQEPAPKTVPRAAKAAPAKQPSAPSAPSPAPRRYPAATELAGLAVLHGAWVPEAEGPFERGGAFHVWVELATETGPTQLTGAALDALLKDLLGETGFAPASADGLLPATQDAAPLPSPEAGRWLDAVSPASAALSPFTWQTRTLEKPLTALAALRLAALERPEAVQLGADLAFWGRFAHAVRMAVVKDQYVPALRLRQDAPGKKGKPAHTPVAGWEFVSAALEAEIARLAPAMPPVCRAVRPTGATAFGLLEAAPLLRQSAEVMLHGLMTHLKLPQSFLNRVDDTFLIAGLLPPPAEAWQTRPTVDPAVYAPWRAWRDRLKAAHTAPAFDLAFQLLAPESEQGPWHLAFAAVSRQDPSLRLFLADYWAEDAKGRERARKPFGAEFEREALLLLGQAARMVSGLWKGLETDRPSGLELTLAEAHAFLKGDAWLLEDAGFRVLVPAWWTPEGRKRVRARLTPAGPAKGKKSSGPGAGVGADGWLAFRYELAIGDKPVTAAEWRSLVDAKTPLVRFRGEWVELDLEQMARVQALVDAAGDKPFQLSPLELVRVAAAADTGDVALDGELESIVARLEDPRALAPVPVPAGLQATLRDYQRRGLDWLTFLDGLGLNGCLADDMGLGKTMQVIARLVAEREAEPQAGPTLLVAPTSVVGNWQKELARFAPGLRVLLHHGSDRAGEAELAAAARAHDVVVTSYALIRRDEARFAGLHWRRVVLDEAQNIKNPQAAQTRAIRKLKSDHRLALTGTPVENRLLDLWSLFDFLNPGYLGKEAAFKKGFETPITRDGDAERAGLLRRLTAPLLLRRVKTDPAIIQDLPDKVEQKLYCPLTPEQASLYEAVVKEAEEAVDGAEGIQRKGVMLATLTKLKQVCNHPAQLLQDGSAFDPARSHKLARLVDHAREIVGSGESLLVFTQFADLGGRLERRMRQEVGCEVHFLHGGTPQAARERMISRFQDPASPPSIFVLSLKAGGVGITLTKANHVFHFDRWWNPAVEEQATDRAFRIGQTRNVFVHKFVTLGTLEERIDAMLEDKRRLADSVLGADESWLAGLDNEAFKALIALDRASVTA